MLPEKNRLRKKKDIDRVYKKGRKFKCPFFLLITLAREEESLPPRYAIVISKRVSTSAVQRNRGRRVLRALIRFFLHQHASGYDTIVLVTAKFFDKKSAEIKECLEEVLLRAKLIKKE